MPEYATGLVNSPAPLGAVNIEPVLGTADLPENFIVPAFRHWFDDGFSPIMDKVNTMSDGAKLARNQRAVDACVGFAFALQKSSVEGKPISPRDFWSRTKALDAERGHPKEAYGASAWAGADSGVNGIADEALVPGDPGSMDRMLYMTVDETEAIRASRRVNRGERAYYVTRDNIARAVFETRHPVATHCTWYRRDNAIGRGGNPPTMTMPEGDNVGGHMFSIIGRITYGGVPCLVAANSWSETWGWFGMFLIPETDVIDRLGNGYVHVDKDQATLTELLARYNEKDVALMGTPDLYRCELGVLRRYPNEIVWWAHGKLFGIDPVDITREHFDVIPKGPDMSIDEAPFRTRELVRQIRQHFGAL